MKHNISRIKQMNKNFTEKVKKRRKDLRKKGYADKEQKNEKVSSYISGGILWHFFIVKRFCFFLVFF